jgi:outer membrane receptor for ferrienterochelin and colicins
MIRVLAAACLVLSLAASAGAQTADVTGTVVDEQGAGVPGATVQLSGTSKRDFTTSGSGGAYRFSNVAVGTYDLTATLVGFAPASGARVVVGPNVSPVTAPALTLKVASFAETVVVSATKTELALVDAPATMSVITNAELQSSPAQNYGDLLRRLPGVNVIQLSARDINLTSRQATGSLANTELVLIDGRSVYLDFFGIVLWDLLPTNLTDVKQIEVIHGPAAAVWGANALTGVVNIITKTPREAKGGEVTFTGGFMSRDAGSKAGQGAGGLGGVNGSWADAPNDTWSYKVTAGWFNSAAFPRPTGQIPLITDPRDSTLKVGGAFYPADGAGAFGTAFSNRGTNQPKFDARVDQELGKNGRLTYEGGVAGTQGIIYTGIGPFDIQSGSYLGFGRVNYTRDALKVNFFTNVLHADAPNLLFPDPATGKALQMTLTTKTYDFEVGDAVPIGTRQVLSAGGNVRRNNFEITLAPTAQDRSEFGAYAQDEIFFDRVRLNIGGRVDKFGNLDSAFFSPRLSANFKVTPDQSIRLSFNRAFKSPSVVNNYLSANVISPQDLSGLAPLLPAVLRPLVATPFPLVVRAVGSELPIGATPQPKLTEESLTAYEIAYTGTFMAKTTIGASFYVNDLKHSINFVQLPASLDPYTAANPPPGWQLPPSILAAMAQLRIFLPRTAFTYQNLGPLRQKGVELSLNHRVDENLSIFANYSWQGLPQILTQTNPADQYPTAELAYPPTNRFNAGFSLDCGHFLGNLSVNYSDKAFWSDVLTAPFAGYTDSYTMVNGSVGARWMNNKLTTSVKVTNLFNQDIQQHIFGDILKRMVVFEVKIRT